MTTSTDILMWKEENLWTGTSPRQRITGSQWLLREEELAPHRDETPCCPVQSGELWNYIPTKNKNGLNRLYVDILVHTHTCMHINVYSNNERRLSTLEWGGNIRLEGQHLRGAGGRKGNVILFLFLFYILIKNTLNGVESRVMGLEKCLSC